MAVLVLGCDSSGPAPTTPSASAATSASAPVPKKSAKPVAKPPPLDLEGIKKALKCRGADGPCRVLEKFAKCREGWSPITQSGDGRWMGRGWKTKKGGFIEDFVMLRTRRVGLAEVAPGALGVKIGVDVFPEAAPEARSAAGPAIRALERSDVPKKGNRAVTFVSEHDSWSESYAQQADNHQIFVAAGAGAYLCGDPQSQALHVVRLSNKRDHLGDGIYATLYPIKW